MKSKHSILLICLFVCFIFFRFYKLLSLASFNWDQLDYAWAAVRIISVHKFPLLGPQAKGSGMYIGPLYYYFAALFYYITGLNPIASPIIAACTSIINFGVLYYVSKNLFNKRTALLSCFIYTFSDFLIQSERVQWQVSFIAPVSLLIFYFLYKVITGESRYLIPLAICTGLAFHTHFTAIFFPIQIFSCILMI